MVEEKADENAILIFGAAVSEDMNDEVAITVIATGFGEGLDEDPIGVLKTSPAKAPKKEPAEVVTENGLVGRSVTLNDIFEETKGEKEEDYRFGDIPTFLTK